MRGYRLGLVLIPPPELPLSILHASGSSDEPRPRVLGSLSWETIVGAVTVALVLLGMHTDTASKAATQDANIAALSDRVKTLETEQKAVVTVVTYDHDTRQLDMTLRQMSDREQAIYNALIARK
jgi:hypothetical protein